MSKRVIISLILLVAQHFVSVANVEVKSSHPYLDSYIALCENRLSIDTGGAISTITCMSGFTDGDTTTIEKMLRSRSIYLYSEIDDNVANVIQSLLLFYDEISTDDIWFYINSPGGQVYSGLGIYDTMQYIISNVNTINTGIAASMAAVLLTAGQKNKRFALRHSRLMIHQPIGGISSQISDIEITSHEILKLKQELYTIISDHSGQPYDKVKKDCESDYWMSAEESKEYGIIDMVIDNLDQITKQKSALLIIN